MENLTLSNSQNNRSNQLGVGLIELLVSMFIGLFVMAGVVQMFATSTQNAVAASGSSRIQENIRYAFYRIREDVSQSGNLGCINASYTSDTTDFAGGVGALENLLGLNADDGEFFDFKGFVFGSESSSGTTFPAGDVTTGTDTLSVRYVSHLARFDVEAYTQNSNNIKIDDTHTEYPTLEQFQIVMVSDCNISNVFMITNDPSSSNGVLEFEADVISTGLNKGQYNIDDELRGEYTPNLENQGAVKPKKSDVSSIPYVYAGRTGAYQYFIGTSENLANGEVCHPTNSPENCSLYRRANATNQELVRGVHDMQVEYGWTSSTGNLIFANATTVAAQNAWAAIDRVNISLSLNSIDKAVTDGNNMSKLLYRNNVSQTINLPNQLGDAL